MATESRKYEPISLGATMSQYGYWIVKVSVSPWQRMSVMIAVTGITPDQATQLALATASRVQAGK